MQQKLTLTPVRRRRNHKRKQSYQRIMLILNRLSDIDFFEHLLRVFEEGVASDPEIQELLELT